MANNFKLKNPVAKTNKLTTLLLALALLTGTLLLSNNAIAGDYLDPDTLQNRWFDGF